MEENRCDLKISGSGSAGGGLYDKILVNGEGSIFGDANCQQLKINGAANINGNITTGHGVVNGKAKIKGDLAGDLLVINGQTDIQGNVSVKHFKVNGMTDVTGNLSSEEINLYGMMKIEGDCNAERLEAKGQIRLTGMLNADDVDIDLYGKSEIKEIGGEKIQIKRAQRAKWKEFIKSIFLPLDHQEGLLSVDTIEGDEIQLEYTKARIVRGNRVTIGAGCIIDKVEYHEEYQPVAGVQVKEVEQV